MVNQHTKKAGHSASLLLFLLGLVLLNTGVVASSFGAAMNLEGMEEVYFSLDYGVCAIFSLLEGNFGGLLTAIAGIVAILSSAFGRYGQAYNFLIIAVTCFIMRSFISLFYGNYACDGARYAPLRGQEVVIESGSSSSSSSTSGTGTSIPK